MTTQRTTTIEKKSPLLVVGFGSIGKRHYANLIALGYKNVYVYDVDESKLSELGNRAVRKLDTKTLQKFNAVFICNPSHLHVKTALVAAEAGCQIFIEKPLALNTRDIDKLKHMVNEKKLTAMVASNYRFISGYVHLKDLATSNKLGKVLFVQVEIRYDVQSARKGTNFRSSYASSSKQSGGVLFDSGAHVIDYLTDLFGTPINLSARTESIFPGNQIDDIALLQIEFPNQVLSAITLDLFSTTRRNYVSIQCENGMIHWDLVKNNLVWEGRNIVQRSKQFYDGVALDARVNHSYKSEMKYFIDLCNKKVSPVSDLTHAESVTRTLELLERSGRQKKRLAYQGN